MLSFKTFSQKETQELGKFFAKKILSKNIKIVSLEGELGGGKTTFLKGFAKALGVKKTLRSPSFLIIKKYPLKLPLIKNFFHIDCWRINSEKEILELGFKEIISDPKNIVAIEWGEKIRRILPSFYLKIKFKILSKNKREIKVFMKNKIKKLNF